MITAVVGLGRFGYFWAEFLKGFGPLWAYNRSSEKPTPPGVLRIEKEQLREVDTLFLCVSISALEKVLLDIRDFLKPGVVVIDTCSVKVHPVQVMKKVLGEDAALVATHPMFGPDSGKNGVQGLPLVISPVQNAQKAFDLWKKRFEDSGLKVLVMAPEEHDRIGAYTQGVTHFVGRLLDRLGLVPEAMATTGYNALLEIIRQTCNDPFQLFLDLQKFNPYTVNMREDLKMAFEALEDVLEPKLDKEIGEE